MCPYPVIQSRKESICSSDAMFCRPSTDTMIHRGSSSIIHHQTKWKIFLHNFRLSFSFSSWTNPSLSHALPAQALSCLGHNCNFVLQLGPRFCGTGHTLVGQIHRFATELTSISHSWKSLVLKKKLWKFFFSVLQKGSWNLSVKLWFSVPILHW